MPERFIRGAGKGFPTSNATDAVVADFNSDGRIDLAAVGAFVSILLGTGTGSLAPPVEYPIASQGTYIVAGDFNGDGAIDLATDAWFGDTLSVLLGNGDGSFQAALPTDVPFFGGPLAVADLDEDGILDLLVSRGVRILLGNGDGTFKAMRIIAGSSDSGALTTADFNGDGHVDVATSGVPGGGVTVYLGDGHGAFPDSHVTAMPVYGPVVSSDFNQDSKPDLALGGFDQLAILLGHGNGTFSAGSPAPLGNGPTALAIGELNGDEKPDLVAAVEQDGTVFAFLGRDDGTFAPGVPHRAADALVSVASGDFDADGAADVVALSTFGLAIVLLGDGTGGLSSPPTYAAGTQPFSVFTGHFSGGPALDIVAANLSSKDLTLLTGLGDGTFSEAAPFPLGFTPGFGIAADFDGGGKTDLAFTTESGIRILLGHGDGSFTILSSFGDVAPWIQAADFNGDGKSDLAALEAAQVIVYLGNGDGTFQTKIASAVPGSALAMAVGRLDGDLRDDLVVSGTGGLSVLLGNGDGTFQPAARVDEGLNFPTDILAADFNGDANLDVALTDHPEPAVRIYLGAGDGTLSGPALQPAGFYPNRLKAVDLNGDSSPDLLVGNSFATVPILLGNGDGTFRRLPDEVAASASQAIAAGDFDDDGRPDFVTAGDNAGRVSVFQNTRCDPRRLGVLREPISCGAPGSPFAIQPVVRVFDDGDNVIPCDTGTVTASLMPGAGTAGAVLSGTTALDAVGGVATFTDLSIDRAGRGYRLHFVHPLAGSTRSRKLTQGLEVAMSGPTLSCEGGSSRYRTGTGGYDRYLWSLDGVPASTAAEPTLLGLSAGDHFLRVQVFQDGCEASSFRVITVGGTPASPAIAAPTWAPVLAKELVARVPSHADSAYRWAIVGGAITAGQGTAEIRFDAGPAGTTMELRAVEISGAGCESPEGRALVQIDFGDVPPTHAFHAAVVAVARNGVSRGCGNGNFCPDASTTRAQAAVLLLRAEHGASYVPPSVFPGGTTFADVEPGDFAAAFIRQLAAQGITTGCGGGNFCPDDPVTRAQMSIFLLRTEHGGDYQPATATGTFFLDVHPLDFGARFIEQLAREGISSGCGNDRFCPDDPVSRAQMAAFLRRTFNLQ